MPLGKEGMQELRALAHSHCLWTSNTSVCSNVMVPLAKEREAYLHRTSSKLTEQIINNNLIFSCPFKHLLWLLKRGIH